MKTISCCLFTCVFLLLASAAMRVYAVEEGSAEPLDDPVYLAGNDEEFSEFLAVADLDWDSRLSTKELLYAYYFADSGSDQKIAQLWLNFNLLNDVCTGLISRESYLSQFDFHSNQGAILYPDAHLEGALWKAAAGEHLVSNLLFPRGLDSINPESVRQRGIGDCAAIAAIASLASTHEGKKKILSYFKPQLQSRISWLSLYVSRWKYLEEVVELFNSWSSTTVDDFLTDRQRYEMADNASLFHSVTPELQWLVSQFWLWGDFRKYGKVVVALPGAMEPVSLSLDELLYQRKQYATAGADGLWLAVLEKAIALTVQDLDGSRVYNEYGMAGLSKKLELYREYGEYRFLEGIHYSSVFFLLTGKSYVQFNRWELSSEQLHELLSLYSRSGRIIVAELSHKAQDLLQDEIQGIHPANIQDLHLDEVQDPYSELYDHHVYAVTAYDKDFRHVSLREVNGVKESIKQETKEALDGTTDGNFVVPLEDFLALFTHFGFVDL